MSDITNISFPVFKQELERLLSIEERYVAGHVIQNIPLFLANLLENEGHSKATTVDVKYCDEILLAKPIVGLVVNKDWGMTKERYHLQIFFACNELAKMFMENFSFLKAKICDTKTHSKRDLKKVYFCLSEHFLEDLLVVADFVTEKTIFDCSGHFQLISDCLDIKRALPESMVVSSHSYLSFVVRLSAEQESVTGTLKEGFLPANKFKDKERNNAINFYAGGILERKGCYEAAIRLFDEVETDSRYYKEANFKLAHLLLVASSSQRQDIYQEKKQQMLEKSFLCLNKVGSPDRVAFLQKMLIEALCGNPGIDLEDRIFVEQEFSPKMVLSLCKMVNHLRQQTEMLKKELAHEARDKLQPQVCVSAVAEELEPHVSTTASLTLPSNPDVEGVVEPAVSDLGVVVSELEVLNAVASMHGNEMPSLVSSPSSSAASSSADVFPSGLYFSLSGLRVPITIRGIRLAKKARVKKTEGLHSSSCPDLRKILGPSTSTL